MVLPRAATLTEEVGPLLREKMVALVDPTAAAVEDLQDFVELRGLVAGGTAQAENLAVLNAAIAALPVDGGVIDLPTGDFSFNGELTANGRKAVTLRGKGGRSGTAKAATTLRFTGTTGDRFFDARNTTGMKFKSLWATHNSATFTGRLIDWRTSTRGSTEDVKLGGSSGVESSVCVDLDGSHTIKFYDTEFQFYDVGVQGMDPAGSNFSIGISWFGSYFGRGNTAHLRDADQGWLADGCVFANLTDGSGRIYGGGRKTTVSGSLTLVGCWAGDITAGGKAQIEHDLRVLSVQGGTYGTGPGGFIKWVLNDTRGTVVEGVRVQGDGTGTFYNFGTTTGHAGVFTPPGNSYGGVGTLWSAPPPDDTLTTDASGNMELRGARFVETVAGYFEAFDRAGTQRLLFNADEQLEFLSAAGVLGLRLAERLFYGYGGTTVIGSGDSNVLSLRTNSLERFRVTPTVGDLQATGHAWNSNRIILGPNYLWVDATGKLRIKNGAPTSDLDGAVVGTQT